MSSGRYIFGLEFPDRSNSLLARSVVRIIGDSTAIVFACELGDETLVKRLLQAGANVNARDERGTTPLMAAAERGHLGIVRGMVALGADVFASDENKWTALNHAAVRSHNRDVFMFLQTRMESQVVRR